MSELTVEKCSLPGAHLRAGDDFAAILARLREKFEEADEKWPAERALIVRDVAEFLILCKYREKQRERLRDKIALFASPMEEKK